MTERPSPSDGSPSGGSPSGGSPPTTTSRARTGRFFAGFLVVALLLAGLVSYLAYPHPDGLDTVARAGCTVTEVDGGERLEGRCIAQHATDHPLASGPFAHYTVGGDGALTGLAGVVGVLATLAVAGGLFRVLRRRSPGTGD
jgi:cobalt/nickel transport protein